MILIDKLLASGIGWVLDRVADAADAEAWDEGRLREELLAAEMDLELGQIDESEYAAIEQEVLARMRSIRERERGEQPAEPTEGTRYAIEAIEADAGEEPAAAPAPARRTKRKKAAAPRARR